MGAGVAGAPGVPQDSSYYRIPTSLYRSGDIIQEDLYFFYQGQYVLYRLKNLVWKKEDEDRLAEFKIQDLFIRFKEKREHQKFIESHLEKVLDSPNISQKEKSELLYQTSVSLVEEIFENPQSTDSLRRSMKSVKNSIHFLSKDRQNFFELMSLATKDFSEYSHALHTAAYSICLADQMGIRSFNQVSSLGIAAMLHDVGKSKIDRELLEKVGPLDEFERKELERHSEYSYEIVRESRTIPEASEMLILQHHERPEGRGYPKGLSDPDIHLFSKIISLADCFDQMTADRPYQKALTPLEAIERLRHEYSLEYDQNLLINFIKMLKR